MSSLDGRPAAGAGDDAGGASAQGGFRAFATTAPDPAEAVAALYDAVGGPDIGFGAIFCSPRYDLTAVGDELARRFGDAPLVGCTTAGEITPNGYEAGSILGITAPAGDCISVSARLDDIAQLDSRTGQECAQSLLAALERRGVKPDPGNTFCLSLVDGMSANEERLIASASAGLGNIPIFGGSAGDGGRYRQSHVLHEGRFHADAAVVTLVHTSHPFKVFSSQHFVGSEEPLIVTDADPQRRLVLELNGESAASEYARVLGVDLDELKREGRYLPPLMVKIGGAYYARSVNRITADDCLQFACAIDVGVPLSLGRNTGLVDSVRRLTRDIRTEIGRPAVVIVADCLARRLEAAREGVQDKLSELFRNNRILGFSAYGEQIGAMHLNHTLTGVAIGAAVRAPTGTRPAVPGEDIVARYERENAKLRKTVAVLRERVERGIDFRADTFSVFQHAIVLEETVRKRTAEVGSANRRLSRELAARKELEAALRSAKRLAEDANRSKSQFVAALCHDMQQPLNAGRLLLGALGDEITSPAGREVLAGIESAFQTAEEMLDAFFDITKLETGGMAVRKSSFALAPLLTQLRDEFAPTARRRGLRLRVVPCHATLHTDRGLLQRVLRNLLHNAIRYTPTGGIVLGCRRRGDAVRIEVWDTGVGIAEKHLTSIFEPFRRLKPGGDNETSGSGLGLAIVDRICELTGLEIDVRSREGRGSVFAVTCPAGDRAPPRAPDAEDDAPAATIAGRRVLVIDDDAWVLGAIKALLEERGCRVDTAAGITEAAERLDAATPDLVVADYHLRDGTGVEAVFDLRQRLGTDLGAVIISSDRRDAVADEAAAADCAFVAKPVRPDALEAAMTRCLTPPPPAPPPAPRPAPPSAPASGRRSTAGRGPRAPRSR